MLLIARPKYVSVYQSEFNQTLCNCGTSLSKVVAFMPGVGPEVTMNHLGWQWRRRSEHEIGKSEDQLEPTRTKRTLL